MTPKEEHAELLKSGMFYEFFPELSGHWEKDAIEFSKFIRNRAQKEEKQTNN